MSTIEDVAKYSGFSTATVSRVLNNKGPVSEKAVLAIQEAMRQLDYHPNNMARALVMGHSNTIGVILPSHNTYFWNEVAVEMEKSAREIGYHIVFRFAEPDREEIDRCVSDLRASQVSGIIQAAGQREDVVKAANIPILSLISNRDGIPAAHGALNMMLIAVCYQVVVMGYALAIVLLRFDLVTNLGTGLGLLLLFGAAVNGVPFSCDVGTFNDDPFIYIAAFGLFTDVSYDEEFAACCGYTSTELMQYFAPNLRYAAALSNGCALAAVSDAQVESLLKDMSEWYDSYSFDGTEQNKVFSTWSVLRFFANAKAVIRPYWSTEEGNGVPQLLKISLSRINLEQLIVKISKGEILIGGKEFLQSSLINPKANPYSLLFQAGYLTFNEPYEPGDNVHLACPNKEIVWGFANLMARHFFNLEIDLCSNESSRKALVALASLDAEQIRAFFNYAIEFLPYTHNPDNEFWSADLIILLLFGLGFKPRVEVMSLHGRADCVFDVPGLHLTIVLEFKFESSADPKHLDAKLAEALQQIKDHDYGLNGTSEPKVARFGLVYCSDPSERKFVRMALADVVEL